MAVPCTRSPVLSQPGTLSLDGDDWSLYWLLPREWERRRVWDKEPPEAASRRIAATVPGHVQLDLIRAGKLPNPYVGLNSLQCEWTSARDWVYEKRFRIPAAFSGLRQRLRFEGIDDAAHVFLNGRRVGDHEGQFVPAEWDVTGLTIADGENRLLVVVERAPDVQRGVGRTSRERRWKSRFAYGWDFSTRLPPVGLWDSVRLIATGAGRYAETAVYTNLANDRSEAAISIVSELDGAADAAALAVADITLDGLPVASVEDPIRLSPRGASLVQSLVVPRAQLWWPNGFGRQPLYQARLTLLDERDGVMDQRIIPFGLRHVEAVPCDGAPPDSLPYSLVANGRRVWIKGWNWVPADLLYAGLTEERYDRLLRLARDAHVNLLRVWGGGLLETEAFYGLCDRYGIMVWQEFPLSSSGIDNEPPSDAPYLEYVRAQAEAILARRRHHPSLVLWGGGNELTGEAAIPLGGDHPALAELRAAVQTEDPQRLWLPTSPTGPSFLADPHRRGELHDVHGPWLWRGLRDHPQFYNRIDPLLHSEFACEGPASAETLRFIFEGDPPPPSTSDPVWMHHGGNRWLRPETVESAFGDVPDVETFVRAGRQLQAMGLQYAVEASRRRKWRCAGTLPWQLNEPWPSAVGTCAVDWSGRPTPAYYAVKRAYRPFHVSAQFDTFSWSGEPVFQADVWLHNTGEERSLLNVVAVIVDLEGRELYQENLAGEAPENSAECVGDLSWRFPTGFAGPFILFLEVIDEEGETIARNAYLHSAAPDPAFMGFVRAPETLLSIERDDGEVLVRNRGAAVALGVEIDAGEALVEDSHFPLAPGGERRISVSDREAPVTVRCWNGSPENPNT
jgi:beta-mannosidase